MNPECPAEVVMLDDRFGSIRKKCGLAEGHLGSHAVPMTACRPFARLEWNDEPRDPSGENHTMREIYKDAVDLLYSIPAETRADAYWTIGAYVYVDLCEAGLAKRSPTLLACPIRFSEDPTVFRIESGRTT